MNRLVQSLLASQATAFFIPTVSPEGDNTASNIQTVQEIYAAFGRGDIPAIPGHLAENVIWEYDKDRCRNTLA